MSEEDLIFLMYVTGHVIWYHNFSKLLELLLILFIVIVFNFSLSSSLLNLVFEGYNMQESKCSSCSSLQISKE